MQMLILLCNYHLDCPKEKGLLRWRSNACLNEYGAEMIPYIIFLGTFHKMMDDFA
jgi:hypothetical protein